MYNLLKAQTMKIVTIQNQKSHKEREGKKFQKIDAFFRNLVFKKV